MCNGTIQRISSKIHVVKDLFDFFYKRMHVDETFIPDHKIISTIRNVSVKKQKLDLIQSCSLVKMSTMLGFHCVCLHVFWEPSALFLL